MNEDNASLYFDQNESTWVVSVTLPHGVLWSTWNEGLTGRDVLLAQDWAAAVLWEERQIGVAAWEPVAGRELPTWNAVMAEAELELGPVVMPAVYQEARELGAYELGRRWADPTTWPLPGPGRTVQHELEELATMAALSGWLMQWIPIHIHTALLQGASLEQVAAAAGTTPAALAPIWLDWAGGQRHLWDTSQPLPSGERPGMSPEMYGTVLGLLSGDEPDDVAW